jgi:hypothetical protein
LRDYWETLLSSWGNETYDMIYESTWNDDHDDAVMKPSAQLYHAYPRVSRTDWNVIHWPQILHRGWPYVRQPSNTLGGRSLKDEVL